MNFFQRAFNRITKAVNPDVFAFYFNKAFPPAIKINYGDAYSSWVFACITVLGTNVSMTNLKMQKLGKDGQWIDSPSDAPLQLLNKPNPIMSGMDLFFATEAWKQIDGNVFWYVAYNLAGKPIELWPLDPRRMIVLKDEMKIINGYNFLNLLGKLVPLKYEEVLFFRTFNPEDSYRGAGALAAARIAMETDIFSGKWNRNFFENSATPESILQTDRKLSTDVYKRLKASWNNEYQGYQNSHKLAILEEGLTFKPTSLNQKDMDFLKLREFTKDEICGIFRVPQMMLGMIDKVNRASADTLEYVFNKEVILPEIRFIVDKLNMFYLPMWGIDATRERIWFDNPVPDDEALEIQKLESGISHYYMTPNEVRAKVGMLPIPGGDVLYVPTLVAPLTPEGTDETPQDTGNNNQNETNETPKKRVKEINQDYKDQQYALGKKQVEGIYENMKTHVLQRLGSGKSVATPRRKSKNPLLAKLQGELDAEDGDNPDIPADPSIEDHTLSDFTTVFSPEVSAEMKILLPPILQTGGNDALLQAGIAGVFDLKNPRAVKWLDEHALELASEVPDTIKGEMATIIRDGVANGDSVQNIAADISHFYDNQSGWRALRVSRTEVKNAYERGNFLGAKQANQKEKQWVKAGNTKEDICNGNEGEGWIPIDDDFISGHSEPTAHANCECFCEYRSKKNV